MPNTLTGLIPIAYRALEQVSRELVGFIPSVGRNAEAERVGLNQTIRVPIAGESALADNTPAVNAPDTGDTTDEFTDMTISKSKHYPIRFNGEEERSLGTSNFEDLMQQKMEQGFRALTNAVEVDLGSLYYKASRAYGTAGTAPFGTKDDFQDFAGVAQILDENGAPVGDRQLVVGSSAMFNLRGKQTGVLQKVNEAGSNEALRLGEFGRIHDMVLRQSAGIASHTKGAGVGYDANGGEPVGETTIALDGGTVNTTGIANGDVVTFAGDSNKYVVQSGLQAIAGNIAINKPGLEEVLADTVEMTIGDSFTANLAFDRNAVMLASRLPAVPSGGDSADDRISIVDPYSGLIFEMAVYRQYRQVHYEIALAWGYDIIKPAHVALLLG